MSVYYNEFDPKAAAWLRELMKCGLIPHGVVDERSITGVKPHEVREYTQCHFFAGIGGWSYALELAGIAPDRPIWTGSCPCQPFSHAGKQMGREDSRHLWPAFRRLINRCRPPEVVGEQVASALGRDWLAGVRANLETMGYAFRAADLCAAGAGAPHIRQRLFWRASRLADAARQRRIREHALLQRNESGRIAEDCTEASGGGETGGVEHAKGHGRQQWRTESGGRGAASGCSTGGMGDADIAGSQGWRLRSGRESSEGAPWASSSAIISCSDGRARRIEPSSFPLAHGIPSRVGLLRGYGNAIVPQIAAIFLEESEEQNENHSGSGRGVLAEEDFEYV